VVSCVLVRILSHPAPARLSRRRTDARGAKVRVPVPVLSLARTQLGVWTQTDRPTGRSAQRVCTLQVLLARLGLGPPVNALSWSLFGLVTRT
jgi:hypothetical protein